MTSRATRATRTRDTEAQAHDRRRTPPTPPSLLLGEEGEGDVCRASARRDRWEIIGNVMMADLREKTGSRVAGKVLIDVMGATHKNRRVMVHVHSRSAFSVAQLCIDRNIPILVSGVMDTSVGGGRQQITLRVTHARPFEEER